MLFRLLFCALFSLTSLSLVGCKADSLAVNEACEANDECAEKICHYGLCAAAKAKDNTHRCVGDGDCKSSLCKEQYCAPRDRETDAACLHGEECASLSCAAGKCAKKAICGDGVKSPGEACDRLNFGDTSCGTLGFDGGELDCTIDCAIDTAGCIGQKWVTLKAGTFTMGSPTSESGRGGGEDQHAVTLSQTFEIADSEVTQKQYQLLRRYNPAQATTGLCADKSCPVERVNWHEAVAYCNALSTAKGLAACYDCRGAGKTILCGTTSAYNGNKIYLCPGYRLPTEAEWEYAYRAGSKTAYYDGLSVDTIGWYQANAQNSPHAVKQKKQNSWGLFDLAGNVWEWCHDFYQASLGTAAVTDPAGPATGDSRLTRGGSWRFPAPTLRAAKRLLNRPTNRYDDVGFRCVRSLSP